MPSSLARKGKINGKVEIFLETMQVSGCVGKVLWVSRKLLEKKNEKQFSNKIDLGKKGPKKQLVDEDKSPSVSCKKSASHSRVKGRIVR